MSERVRAAGRRVLEQYKAVDLRLAEVAKEFDVSCRRGCSHCCYQIVGTTVLEAVSLAGWVLDTFAPPNLAALRAQLKTEADAIDAAGGIMKYRKEYLSEHRACVFLDSAGECAVYELRPIACRAYMVVSPPADCAPGGSSDGNVAVVNLAPQSTLFSAIAMLQEQETVPAACDSLQRCLLVALDLLEGRPVAVERLPDEGLRAFVRAKVAQW